MTGCQDFVVAGTDVAVQVENEHTDEDHGHDDAAKASLNGVYVWAVTASISTAMEMLMMVLDALCWLFVVEASRLVGSDSLFTDRTFDNSVLGLSEFDSITDQQYLIVVLK